MPEVPNSELAPTLAACPKCGFRSLVVTRPDGTRRLADHKKRGAAKCVGVDL